MRQADISTSLGQSFVVRSRSFVISHQFREARSPVIGATERCVRQSSDDTRSSGPTHRRSMQDFRKLRVWQCAHELALATKEAAGIPEGLPRRAQVPTRSSSRFDCQQYCRRLRRGNPKGVCAIPQSFVISHQFLKRSTHGDQTIATLTASLRAQRNDRIDTRCASRGEIAGDECDARQAKHGRRDRHGIAALDAEQQARHEPRDAC